MEMPWRYASSLPRPGTMFWGTALALALAACGAAQESPSEPATAPTSTEAAAESTADAPEDAAAPPAEASSPQKQSSEADMDRPADDGDPTAAASAASSGTASATAPSGTIPSPADADGRWCPAPDSDPGWGCVVLAYPQVTIEDTGEDVEVELVGEDDECLVLSGADAPFGSFCPAGTALTLPDYYPGEDHPEQDRIWNSQTAVLLLRA